MVDEYDAREARRMKSYLPLLFPMYSPMHLPSARGIWPLGDGGTGDASDVSGRGRRLADAGGVTYDIDNFMGYANLNGSNEYLWIADGNGIGITGGLGMGIWVYFDNTASALEVVMGKIRTGTNNRSYRLSRNSIGNIVALVSSNGTATTTATSAQVVAATTWAYIGLTYDPSNSLSVFVGTVGGDDGLLEKTTNTTSIPASINNSNANFAIGAQSTSGTPADHMAGRVALAFLLAVFPPDKMHNLIYAQTRELLVV